MNGRDCPHCGKPVYDDEATQCIFCGGNLPYEVRGFMSKMKYPTPRIIATIVVLIVLLAFVFLMVL
jgi:hypothetical protein